MFLERAYKRQEFVLRNFRMRECNLLIGPRFLESGIDLPRCNLVIRFDSPPDYQSFAWGKARARGQDAMHYMFVPRSEISSQVTAIAKYHVIEQVSLEITYIVN